MKLSEIVESTVYRYGKAEANFGPSNVRYSVYRHLRTSEIATAAARAAPGDLAEIGVRAGLTTVLLAMVAAAHDRHVVAIDPWQSKYQRDRKRFVRRVKPWRDRIEVVVGRSEAKGVAVALDRDLCLAYLDGNHRYEVARGDLERVAHATVIVVDDINHLKGPRRAWNEMAARLGQPISHPRVREGYIVTRDAELPG